MQDESERRWREEKEESERRDAEWQAKWDENQATLRQMQDESQRRWREEKEESERRWQEFLAEMEQFREDMNRRMETKLGGIGARWGHETEAVFRDALRGILKEVPGIQVLRVEEFDDEGEVLAHPSTVELDIIIRNGMMMVCEIKASVSQTEVAGFQRKIKFYEKRHQCQFTHKILISPMIYKPARSLAQTFGMLIYDYAEDVLADAEPPEGEA